MSSLFDRQSLNSSIKLLVGLSVLASWMAFFYLSACVSFDIEHLPDITEARVLIFGYLAYGVWLFIDLIQVDDFEEISKTWGGLFAWSMAIFVVAFIYTSLVENYYHACMGGAVTPFPDCARPEGQLLSQYAFPLSSPVSNFLLKILSKKKAE